MSNQKSRTFLFLFLALLVALLAALPLLLNPGFLNTRGGGDSPFLLQRLQQLETAVVSGHFPVRWMPDANYGFGYPFYNFYAPLSIYIAGFFRLLGFNFIGAVEMAQLAGFLFAAWGMFKLGKRWLGSSWAGLLTAVAYTVAPFHMVNIYVRGDSLAEFWAMAFYPWIILAVDELIDCINQNRPCRLAAGGLALAYAALILSHNISALIFSPFLLLYILLRWWFVPGKGADQTVHDWPSINPRPLIMALLALMLAFTLAAWFFVPALAEQDLAQLGPVTEGYFHYSNHFRSSDLVQTGLIFDYSVSGGNAFRMGLVQALTAVAGLITLIWYWKRVRNHAAKLFIVLTLLIATFMITPLSQPLWDHLPLLSFTQFPWRFLSVQALATALASGALALLPGRRFIVPLTVLLLIISGLGALKTDHLRLSDTDINGERLAQYEWFTGNIGSTVSAEYLPPSVQPRPFSSHWLTSGQRDTIQTLQGELLSAKLLERRSTKQIWQIETAVSPITLILPTLYWPGWMAELDGTAVPIQAASSSGLITLDVPAGDHTIILRLAPTPIRRGAELLSLMALLLLLWLIRPHHWRSAVRVTAVVLVIFIVAAVLLRLWPQPVYSDNNLSWDFGQMGYLHHDEAGIYFENGALLAEYDYDAEVVQAGETLTIMLNWHEIATAEATLSLVTPAVAWPTVNPAAPVFSSQTLPVSKDTVRYVLPIPENVPAGLVVPQLTLGNGRPLMPSGQTRGELFLRPLRIINQQPDSHDRPLDVRAVTAELRDAHTLDVQLAWFTQQALSHNYNVSLRLSDVNGVVLAQLDTQPGYGLQPSSSWPIGEWTNDWLALPLPDDLPSINPYALTARLYEIGTKEEVLMRRLGTVIPHNDTFHFQPHQANFTLPELEVPLTAVFDDKISFRGVTQQQNGSAVQITLFWEALVDGQTSYTRFVHLIDPQTGEIMAQVDSLPMANSYPTDQWKQGEVVTDVLSLDISDLPAGDYQIVVGLYQRVGEAFERATAVAPDGTHFPDNRVPLPEQIKVK